MRHSSVDCIVGEGNGVNARSSLYAGSDGAYKIVKQGGISGLGFNPLAAKLFNLNFHPLEVVSR